MTKTSSLHNFTAAARPRLPLTLLLPACLYLPLQPDKTFPIGCPPLTSRPSQSHRAVELPLVMLPPLSSTPLNPSGDRRYV